MATKNENMATKNEDIELKMKKKEKKKQALIQVSPSSSTLNSNVEFGREYDLFELAKLAADADQRYFVSLRDMCLAVRLLR
jgi:histone H3/H4